MRDSRCFSWLGPAMRMDKSCCWKGEVEGVCAWGMAAGFGSGGIERGMAGESESDASCASCDTGVMELAPRASALRWSCASCDMARHGTVIVPTNYCLCASLMSCGLMFVRPSGVRSVHCRSVSLSCRAFGAFCCETAGVSSEVSRARGGAVGPAVELSGPWRNR